MSANDNIFILVTTDKEGRSEFRVAHVHNVEELYGQGIRHRTAFVVSYLGDCHVFSDEAAALHEASRLDEECNKKGFFKRLQTWARRLGKLNVIDTSGSMPTPLKAHRQKSKQHLSK